MHLIQRGNNRAPCFFADDDYGCYLDNLAEAAERYGCALHAYVLVTNHVHLLVTPGTESAISQMMQALGRRYVRYVNSAYRRTGTLWEGRHKASPIDSDAYLLVCYRYIELNPVRAGMVESPTAYRWSSHRWHAQAEPNPYIIDHPLYQELGSTPAERAKAYREIFATQLDSGQLHAIREAANVGVPLGNDRFREQIESALQRKVGYTRRGRPTARVDIGLVNGQQEGAQ